MTVHHVREANEQGERIGRRIDKWIIGANRQNLSWGEVSVGKSQPKATESELMATVGYGVESRSPAPSKAGGKVSNPHNMTVSV